MRVKSMSPPNEIDGLASEDGARRAWPVTLRTLPPEDHAPATLRAKEEYMATAPTLGNGPVDYTDANGEQFSIPLSDLQFKNGQIDDSGWTNTAAASDGVLKLLKYLE